MTGSSSGLEGLGCAQLQSSGVLCFCSLGGFKCVHIFRKGGLSSPASVRAVQGGRAVCSWTIGRDGDTQHLIHPLSVPPWKGKAVAVLSQSRTKGSFILSGDTF